MTAVLALFREAWREGRVGKAVVVLTVLVVTYLVLYALPRLALLAWRHGEAALETGIVLAAVVLFACALLRERG